MRIQKKRVLSLEANLIGIQPGTELRAAIPVSAISTDVLVQAGFTAEGKVGEQVLPTIVGPVTRYNAEGREVVHRNLPKETCYRQREWNYYEWHGKEQVPATKIVDVRYQRYPRTLVPPPSIELSIAQRLDGTKIVVAPVTAYAPQHPDLLRHTINLMLELFGICDLLDTALTPVGVVPTLSLNWKVLPAGKMPWPQLQPLLDSVLAGQKPGKKPVITFRLKTISQYGPEFTAVGHGGFSGYVVFGFPNLDLYVLECARYANATYVLGGDWQQLSRLTKAEILDGDLHKDRLIHVEKWPCRIEELLGGSGQGKAKAA